jgi:glycerol-3-phosphate O-acyltransferase/dihydroxyacetone phosphate acyltransferase
MMLIHSSERPISFIIAAKSYRRPIIGWFAKQIQAIPVERPQDLVSKGLGTISAVKENGIVLGKDTKFISLFHKNDTIIIKDVQILILG